MVGFRTKIGVGLGWVTSKVEFHQAALRECRCIAALRIGISFDVLTGLRTWAINRGFWPEFSSVAKSSRARTSYQNSMKNEMFEQFCRGGGEGGGKGEKVDHDFSPEGRQ